MDSDRYIKASELVDLIDERIKSAVNALKFVKMESATVTSYDSNTRLTHVTFPADSTDVVLKNMGYKDLVAGNIVEVVLKNNNLTNAYIIAVR